MQNNGFKVPPLSRLAINNIANHTRNYLHPSQNTQVDIIKIFEFILPKLIPNFTFEVCEIEAMRGDHGRTYPDRLLIQIREDIYINACKGNGRDRFTCTHELGHLVLHPNVPLTRTAHTTPHKAYEDSEWQANIFASEFLMPEKEIIHCKTIREAVERFNVSETAARVRFNQLGRH